MRSGISDQFLEIRSTTLEGWLLLLADFWTISKKSFWNLKRLLVLILWSDVTMAFWCVKSPAQAKLASIPSNSFLNYQSEIHFWANLGWKSQSCLFFLKTGTHAHTHSISKMLILISILVFSNFKPKCWGCWFLFWD